MNKKLTLEELEDFAFYESGLSADGCLEKIDIYMKQSIMRYGRILLKERKNINDFHLKNLVAILK